MRTVLFTYNASYTRLTELPLDLYSPLIPILYSAYNLFASNNTYALNLYRGDLQTRTVLTTHNASSHKTDKITTLSLFSSAKSSVIVTFLAF